MAQSKGFEDFIRDLANACRLDAYPPGHMAPGWDGEPDIHPRDLEDSEVGKPARDPFNDALYSGTAGTSELDGVYPVYGNSDPDPSGRGW